MSNYQQGCDPAPESSNASPRVPHVRYHSNPYASSTHTPNSLQPTSSGCASGSHTPSTCASSSRVPPSTNLTNGPWDPNAYNNYHQTPNALPSPPQQSADPQWDMNGRPLDRPRSRQPSDYGTPLPTSNVDWNRASEMEQQAILARPAAPTPNQWQEYAETQQPQPLPQVKDEQQRLAPANMHASAATIPGTARQAQHYHAPAPAATAATVAPILVPEGSVGVVKEVTLETQPVATRRRVSFTTEAQRPVTTIQATAAQVSSVTDQRPTVTLDQLKAIKERKSDESNQAEQGLSVRRNGTLPVLKPKFERKPSFRRSLSRAGRKVSQAMLDALRLGHEPPVVFHADKILAEWNTYLLQFHKKHTAMEDAFGPFQDQIEDALDAKYVELLGEGNFLIDEESTELSAEVPAELPVQEVSVVPTEDADTWMAHKKAEEATAEHRDIYTGGARRRLPASEMVVHPPKPRTYPAGPPPPAPVPEPVEPEPLVEPEPTEEEQRYSTPDPVDSSQPVQLEAEVEDEQPKTPSPPAKERQSRLPRPVSNRSGRSTSRQRSTGRQSSAAQSVEEPKSRAPSKIRKDSAQTGSSAKPPAPRRAQSRNQERYPKINNVKK